jgi:hypothetical protein
MLSAGTALVLASLSPRINALRTSP